ncbi:hypothetical protein M0R72_06705 [Candidatus Pacearchaeota archaeon]|jgi:hypothetical protein|nr:hypothetical protein [Candidatus Pacearchaeota archaeon]
MAEKPDRIRVDTTQAPVALLTACQPWYIKLWQGIGGRKFIALIIGSGVYVWKGEISLNYLLLLCAYMGANVALDYLRGRNGGKPSNGG